MEISKLSCGKREPVSLDVLVARSWMFGDKMELFEHCILSWVRFSFHRVLIYIHTAVWRGNTKNEPYNNSALALSCIRNNGNNGVNHAMDSESSVGPGKQVELTWNSYYLMLIIQNQRVNLLNENHHIKSENEHLQKLLIMGSLAYYSGNWTFYPWKMQFNLDSNKSHC